MATLNIFARRNPIGTLLKGSCKTRVYGGIGFLTRYGVYKFGVQPAITLTKNNYKTFGGGVTKFGLFGRIVKGYFGTFYTIFSDGTICFLGLGLTTYGFIFGRGTRRSFTFFYSCKTSSITTTSTSGGDIGVLMVGGVLFDFSFFYSYGLTFRRLSRFYGYFIGYSFFIVRYFSPW